MLKVDVPLPDMLVVDSESVSPTGDELLVRSIMPENPRREVTVIVEVQEPPPTVRNKNSGLAERSKSGPMTFTSRSAVVVKTVLFPVTVTK